MVKDRHILTMSMTHGQKELFECVIVLIMAGKMNDFKVTVSDFGDKICIKS